MEQWVFVIRPAQADDGAAVAAVYGPYVRDTAVSFEVEPPTGAVMAERISGTLDTHPWLVAEREGVVVGFAYAGKHSQRAAYRWTVDVTVYVGDAERRNGVGRQLYQVLLATLRLQGFRSAFAEIVLPNPGSVRLHEAMGFRHVGIHNDIGHKLGRWHDIGYWRLGLADGPEPPREPVPFAVLRHAPTFDDVLARLLLQVDGEEQPVIQLTAEERADLADADAEIARGEFATDEQTRAMLAKRSV